MIAQNYVHFFNLRQVYYDMRATKKNNNTAYSYLQYLTSVMEKNKNKANSLLPLHMNAGHDDRQRYVRLVNKFFLYIMYQNIICIL